MADLLSKLARTKTPGYNRTVIQETLVAPNIEAEETYALDVISGLSWMSPRLCYLKEDEIPQNEMEAKTV